MLELLLPAGHSTQQEDHARRRHDERNADDRLLRNVALFAAPRPTKEAGGQERHAERQQKRDAIVELIPQDESHTGAEGRDLREREVDENDLALDDMEAQVDE